jgi:hypothetical protein
MECRKHSGSHMAAVIENEHLLRASLRAGLNLFLGAGFSVLARNRDSCLPLGGEFANIVRATFPDIPLQPSLLLPQVSTIVSAREKEAFRQLVVRTYTVEQFDQRYLALRKARVANVFTTNVDNLVHRIADASPTWYIRDVFLNGPEPANAHAAHFYALHGSVLHKDRDLVFGASEIASAFGKDPQLWNHLASLIGQYPTLFWGYNMDDAGTLQAIHNQLGPHARKKERWILVHPSAKGNEDYFRALGFSIIYADTKEMLDYLDDFEPEQDSRPGAAANNSLVEYDIPPITAVPARELDLFYMGATPTWFDIYQNGPAETSHLTACRNAMASGRSVIIKGIPFSGKSTLLMMLAARHAPRDRQKLFATYLNEAEAKRIVKNLDSAQATIFIDDMFESLSAVRVLQQESQIQIVGADRAHNFQSAFHLIDIGSFATIDVTELTASDVQLIREKIPPKLRADARRNYARDELSLFEIVELFTRTPNVSERIGQVFRQIGAEDQLTSELLVLFAYMHQARIPVPRDLLISYCGVQNVQWDDVQFYLDTIGKLVREYEGLYADQTQDYFASRSAIFAEKSLMKAPSKVVKRVLEVVHKEISILKIPRYDVFQRHAFDNEIFARAFPNWEDGYGLYSYVYERDVDGDRSPYIMQQCALYASRKHRHKEAFKAIDEALRRSRGRIFSIRNTHAVVLFRANIEVSGDDDGNVLSSLQRSMDILQECYRDDRRKYNHALTFARQTLKFHERYGDLGLEYLDTAENWLQEELRTATHSREMYKLLLDVRGRLGRP